MPSPFGRRGAATYYQYGGEPYHYDYNWKGMPQAVRGAVNRALGDYVDITATYHKDLGNYPVAMTLQTGRSSLLHSGPEQTHISSEPLGAAQLSRNEKRMITIAGVGVLGYLAWKKWGRRK